VLLFVQQFRKLRVLLRSGVLLFTAGAILDLAAHLSPAVGALPIAATGVDVETAAHILTFVGMAVLLLGVLATARRQPSKASAQAQFKERRPPA
jgi:hypothetical protein